MTVRPRISWRQTAAFTLIEILVASAILVVIVGMVMGLTGMVLRGWNQGTSTLERDAQLQQAYQLFQYDMESAVVPTDDRPWLWAEETTDEGFSIKWAVPAADGRGLEMVEWALISRNALGQSSGAEERSLFRGEWGPAQWAARTGLEETIGSGGPVDEFSTASDWWQAFVLAHVRAWSWEFFVRDEEGRRRALSDLGIPTAGAPLSFPLVAEGRYWQRPDMIEVRLEVLSTDAARQLARLEEEVGAGESTDAFLRQETRVVVWVFSVGGHR